MVNYFIDLFTKPEYLWTALDRWAMAGLIVALLIVAFIIWIIVVVILDKVKKSKFKRCKQILPNGHRCYNHEDCLSCAWYEKEPKKENKRNG